MSYMGTQFDAILRKYGHNIYLNRRLPDVSETPKYSDKFEIWTVRHRVPQSLSSVEKDTAAGILNTSERLYYFQAIAHPFDGDRIYEDDPRVDQTVWVIDTAVPMRGLNGELDYYIVGATRIRPN